MKKEQIYFPVTSVQSGMEYQHEIPDIRKWGDKYHRKNKVKHWQFDSSIQNIPYLLSLRVPWGLAPLQLLELSYHTPLWQ